jgi:hypothetical protein
MQRRPTASKRTTVTEILQEAVPMVCFVSVEGPRAILLVGPPVLLVLLLLPPAKLLITFAIGLPRGAGLLVVPGALMRRRICCCATCPHGIQPTSTTSHITEAKGTEMKTVVIGGTGLIGSKLVAVTEVSHA